jgi:hypothetical protein
MAQLSSPTVCALSVWFTFTVLTGFVLFRKGYSPLWALPLGMFLGPLGLIIALFLNRRRRW